MVDEEPVLELDESLQENNESVELEVTIDASLEKAIEVYRKIREEKGPLSDKELADLDKECEVIRKREIIMSDVEHEIQELESDGKLMITFYFILN